MRRVRKVITRILIFFLVMSLVLAAAGVWFIRRSWPQLDGTISVSGLSAPVRVVRDQWGIPHIYAETDRDLVFAQGYVHSQDRLWQMEFNRRLGSGTLSAALGEATLGFDKLIRTMGLRRAAHREWELLDTDSRALLEAYAAGVNAYVDAHRSRLPIEFTILGIDPEPWTPLDTLTWGKVMSWNLGWNYDSELMRARLIAEKGPDVAQELLPPFKQEVTLDIPAEARSYAWLRGADMNGLDDLAAVLGGPNMSQGSNGWAVHGSRTASGKPILVNDTHLYLDMPSGWYENGLHGGSFDIVGFSFPGVPLVIMGQNSRVSWGITDIPADVQDFYIENVDDESNPTQYEFMGEWQPLQVITETIDVSGSEPITLTIEFTNHGPLMNEAIGTLKTARPLALRWSLTESAPLFKALVDLNRATNWDSFRQALKGWGAPNLNFIYADVDGNIGYQAAGTIPIRAANYQGLVPMPGESGDYEWEGYIPFDQLPSIFNPPSGFVANANSKVTTDDDRYHLSFEWGDPYRIQRITELLSADHQFTVEDMQKIQGESYSPPAEQLRPYLLSVSPTNDMQRRALEQVKNWNLSSDADQAAPSIFHLWYWFLIQNTVQDELSAELNEDYRSYFWLHASVLSQWIADANNPWFDDHKTPEAETREDMARRSLDDAIAWLSERYGNEPEQWQWGKIHTMNFVHRPIGQSGIGVLESIFNSNPIPVSGDNFTVNAAWFNPDADFVMSGGTAHRFIAEMSDAGNTLAIHTTGQNEQIFHPHRKDFIPLWQNVEYHQVLLTPQSVTAAAKNTLVLQPQPGP